MQNEILPDTIFLALFVLDRCPILAGQPLVPILRPLRLDHTYESGVAVVAGSHIHSNDALPLFELMLQSNTIEEVKRVL